MREYPVDFEYHGTQTLPDEISEFKTISLSGEIEIHIEYYTTSECERDSFRQEIHTITL